MSLQTTLDYNSLIIFKDVGNKKLDEGQKMQDCLRGPLCSLFLLIYHGFLSYLFGKIIAQ